MYCTSFTCSMNGFKRVGNQEVEVEIVDKPVASQNSVVTIFSMWNTMMGTSLLSMPWALKQAGFVNGIVLLCVMAAINAYTSYIVLASGRFLPGGDKEVQEFTAVVHKFLGRSVEVIALMCSLLTLLGGQIVYWILMSNFLYTDVIFVYHHAHHDENSSIPNGNDSNNHFSDVICSNMTDEGSNLPDSFKHAWDENYTVPFFLILLVFPLLNFKNATFFTKFNALGTLSVTTLSIFVAYKASKWGVHLDFNPDHSQLNDYSPNFEWTFAALTGIASLAYFLQNCVTAIARPQKHPENNTRDLCIAYVLACITYVYVGSVFYAFYPLDKSCIEDNLLLNISSTDTFGFIARFGLFFQMMCVLPLLFYVFRSQFLLWAFNNVWPSWKHVVVLNAVIVCICLVFAVFLPHIGHIISFVGAFCGFTYAIAIPCAVFMVTRHQNGNLTIPKIIFHTILIIIGLANFIGQFVILGHTK